MYLILHLTSGKNKLRIWNEKACVIIGYNTIIPFLHNFERSLSARERLLHVGVTTYDTSLNVSHFLGRLCIVTLPVHMLPLEHHLLEDATCTWCLTNNMAYLCLVVNTWRSCGRIVGALLIRRKGTQRCCCGPLRWERLDNKGKYKDLMWVAWCIWGEKKVI